LKLQNIAWEFVSGLTGISPLGNGLINDTYLITGGAGPIVLQRINTKVFDKPELIMANLKVLCEHRNSLTDNVVSLKIPELIQTRSGQDFFYDLNAGYWRAWEYIGNSESIEKLSSLEQAKQVGCALAQFHRLTYKLDISGMHDTLPGFHITPGYNQKYLETISVSRIPEDEYCAGFIAGFQDKLNDLENAKAEGLLVERVIHGDPKLNNFLFDKNTGVIISLIDLDTVKPGLIHYDIGDCLRSCCHRLKDDSFDLGICRSLLQGYLQIMEDLLTQADVDWLFPAIRLIPFELGLRFYTDYLNGNVYFKVKKPDENLYRAKSQFRLCTSVMAQENEIKDLFEQFQLKSWS